MLLTAAQASVVNAIRNLTAELGYPPSIREIGDRSVMASPSTVGHHIRRLAELGVLTYTPSAPRTIRLTISPPLPLPVPTQELTDEEHAEASQRERELRGARGAATRARNKARRATDALDAVRALHKPRKEYPPALDDSGDRDCQHCGRHVGQLIEGHRWDVHRDLMVCTLVPRLPAVCAHCTDPHGQRRPYPCPTLTAIDAALAP